MKVSSDISSLTRILNSSLIRLVKGATSHSEAVCVCGDCEMKGTQYATVQRSNMKVSRLFSVLAS